MTANSPSPFVPKLRFPEFRNGPEWEPRRLGDIATFFKGKGLPKSILSINGTTQCIHYGELFTSYPEVIRTIKSRTDLDENLFLSAEDDVLMPTSDVTPNGLAKACCLKLSDVIIGGDVMVIRTDHQRISGEFLARYIRHLEQRVLQLVTGSTVYHLYANALKMLDLCIPSQLEQRKIADCLGSLDDLIAAEDQKLETLRQHKQGLMQQLFPRPGETVPRLRFPEFKDAPEWESRELGPMTSKIGSGVTPRGGERNYRSSGRPFVRSQNVGWGDLILDKVVHIEEDTHASFGATEVKDGDVLLNISGASIGRCAVADERIAGGNVNQHVCIIRCLSEQSQAWFLSQYLISKHGQDQIDSCQAGGNRQGLNFGQIRSLLIPQPKDVAEQELIADCLRSADVTVAAQTKRISDLWRQKQGLIQQLFPSLVEH